MEITIQGHIGLAGIWMENASHQLLFQIKLQNLVEDRLYCKRQQNVMGQLLVSLLMVVRGRYKAAKLEKQVGLILGVPQRVLIAGSVLSPAWWLVMMLCLAACGQHKQAMGPPRKKTNPFITYSSHGKWQTLILLTLRTQFVPPHLPHPSSHVEKGLPIQMSFHNTSRQFWTNTNHIRKWLHVHLSASLCHFFHLPVAWLSSTDVLSCFRKILHHMALTWWVLMDGKSSCWEKSHRDGCLNWGMKQKHILI